VLRLRAELLAKIRRFFAERDVLEVETPCLSRSAVCAPHLHSLAANIQLPDEAESRTYYLNTSPEFAMKRLLAAGSGPIYQIARVFRDGERGAWHNPEFTMLEWYRPGFSYHQLMDEVEDLVNALLGNIRCERRTYAELFQEHLHIDPHRVELEQLAASAKQCGLNTDGNESLSRDDYLDLILSHALAPKIKHNYMFLLDFPVNQAALARIRPGNPPVAERFELVINGMEIANGFQELTDADEQAARFDAELRERQERGLPAIPVDGDLLAALEHGLPECAGVALGFDRLVMLAVGAQRIEEVLAFPAARA
jgi:lysyl-tRNA synthetase class 2